MNIARVFFNVHMGQNFKGLLKVCHDAGMRPEAMAKSYIVFVNSSRTKFKLLVGNKYLVYHDNGHREFDLGALRYLPEAFKGGKFSFDASVRRALSKHIKPEVMAQVAN